MKIVFLLVVMYFKMDSRPNETNTIYVKSRLVVRARLEQGIFKGKS
jgi:hypothetical protein